jgi:polysaccharide lyase-like protein
MKFLSTKFAAAKECIVAVILAGISSKVVTFSDISNPCLQLRRHTLAAALLLVGTLFPGLVVANNDFEVSFEPGYELLGDFDCKGNCPKISDEYARDGLSSLKSFLNRNTSKNPNSTSVQLLDTSNDVFNMTHDTDYWLGFSTLLPNSWSHSGSTEIVAQLQSTGGSAVPVQIRTGTGDWQVISRGQDTPAKSYKLNSAYDDLGTWVDWVMHYRPSHTSNGLLRLWKNGDLVIDQVGRPTAFNYDAGPFWKMGTWLPWTDRECCDDLPAGKQVFYDALRVSSGMDAGYEDVVPRPLTAPIPADEANERVSLDYNVDFESDAVFEDVSCSGNCPTIDTAYAREGKSALKSSLNRRTSDVSFRTEMKIRGGMRGPQKMTWGRDYWIGFSILLPNDWIHSGDGELLAQIHASPNDGRGYSGVPFEIRAGRGDWEIWTRGQSVKKKLYTLNDAYTDRGHWVDWVVHYRPSYDSNGIIRVWKNGALVVDQTDRPTAAKSNIGPYWKMGVYAGVWKDRNCCNNTPEEKVVYHDALRIASGPDAGYHDVAPQGQATKQPGSRTDP